MLQSQENKPTFKVRPEEPAYAFIPPAGAARLNQHGKAIDLVDPANALAGQSLRINNNPVVGDNPNRYKQHGFHFTADNCIGCHACEAACSEKNDLPAHISFRSVGYVEGGTYPDFRRVNISMACNHCDNPVCLKGCPTRAYTKFAEYGAVLQDPDICFGCGYCTWVCPYNAPQLDPIKGQVSKCNMCVDRLEVGLKPACAAACLGGALDFGVVETAPENRVQTKLDIPGFPTTDITHPNIRFQQTRELPREMRRTDTTPLVYVKQTQDGKTSYKPQLAETQRARQWNLKKLLGSHENAHVAFTLSAQAVMGAFALLMLPASAALVALPTLFVMLALMGFGLFRLNMHLGKPMRFYRGFNNWRLSPVSREIAGVSLFFGGLAGYTFFTLFPGFPGAGLFRPLTAAAALLGLAFGGYYMIKLYLIPARPYWNHWQTATSFVGTALGLGGLLLGLMGAALGVIDTALASLLGAAMAAGFGLEAVGLFAHARRMRARGDEGAVAHFEQTTTYGWPYLVRNGLLGLALALAVVLAATGQALLLAPIALAAVCSAIIGRSLFYAVVIPTTMPGAFFWRNKGFAEHARETGLARVVAAGVLPDAH
ncbi:MAG: dimethyl sulfoxide reductase anchor subunit [Rhodocyclaceae bacterium]|nr:dimethyl sulfoxide reductase anchor subunit [Rhodocyclaceae bacterium]